MSAGANVKVLRVVAGRPVGRAGRLASLGVCAAAVLLVALVWCGPAGALGARGHVFSAAFGSLGTGASEFSEPGAVAVNEASGDVYVVDRGNERVQRFSSGGVFLGAWGWGVTDGASEYEVCESGCQPWHAGSGRGEFKGPGAIAVDNSSSVSDSSRGDVYVVSDTSLEHGRVWKFSAAGEFLESVKELGSEPKWEGLLDGLAVDGAGRLWVYRGGEFGEGTIERFSAALKNKFEEPAFESPLGCAMAGFAVDAAGERLLVGHERENREEACPGLEGEAPRPVVAGESPWKANC